MMSLEEIRNELRYSSNGARYSSLFDADSCLKFEARDFGYNCGNRLSISMSDTGWILAIHEKFPDDAANAIVAFVTEHLPVRKKITEEFKQALQLLREWEKNKTIEYVYSRTSPMTPRRGIMSRYVGRYR